VTHESSAVAARPPDDRRHSTAWRYVATRLVRKPGDRCHTRAMPSIAIDQTDLVVTLQPNEKRWGFLADLRVAVSSISEVEVVGDGRKAVRGIRAPGLGGPRRLIGTWRASGNKQYVCVRRNQPAVKVTLEGHRFRTLLIGSDEAERVAGEIRTAAAV
jgi:hypothetical protein